MFLWNTSIGKTELISPIPTIAVDPIFKRGDNIEIMVIAFVQSENL